MFPFQGEIIVANEVDREIQGLGTNTHGHKAFKLMIMASDLGNKPLASTTEVTTVFLLGIITDVTDMVTYVIRTVVYRFAYIRSF